MDMASVNIARIVERGTRLPEEKTCACGHSTTFIEGDAVICKEGRLWLECPSCCSTMTITPSPLPF
jgi:hypothetical protein